MKGLLNEPKFIGAQLSVNVVEYANADTDVDVDATAATFATFATFASVATVANF